MRVSVCDDLIEAIEDLKEKLSHFPEITSIDTYSDLDVFAKSIGKAEYDICFMDIDWGKEKMLGIDFAERLKGCAIIFVTAYPMEFAERIFDKTYTPSGFLIKPAKEEQIAILLEKVQRERRMKMKTISFSINGKCLVTKFEDIIFLEGVLHKTKVHLKDRKELIVNKSLSELSESMPEYFLRCHKSFVVNPQYVETLKADKVTLKTAEAISVSRARRADTKARFMDYLANQ